MRRAFLGPLGVLGTVTVWHLLAVWPLQLAGLPAPLSTFESLGRAVFGADLWAATWHTIRLTAIAVAIATILGATVGTIMGMSRMVAGYLGFSINTLRFIPPVAFIPVVLLVFGLGSTSEIVLGVTAAVWPVLLNVEAAVRSLHARYSDLARVQRLGAVSRVSKIFVPGAIGGTLIGVRLAAALALILVVAAEMLAVSAGLGHQIRFLGNALRLPEMYAYVIWIGAVGLAINTLLEASRRVVAPWTSLS